MCSCGRLLSHSWSFATSSAYSLVSSQGRELLSYLTALRETRPQK